MKNVKPLAIGLLLGAIIVALVPASAAAETDNAYTNNQTDVWVWVTAIGYVRHFIGGSYDNIAAYCVGPHSYSKRGGFSTKVQSLRYEVTSGRDCAHPVLKDVTITNIVRSKTVETLIEQKQCPDNSFRSYTCYDVHTPVKLE